MSKYKHPDSIYPPWRICALHWFAKALGVLVHVQGFPYGSLRMQGYGPVTDGSTLELILATAIAKAQRESENPTLAAEDAARAFKAGLIAFASPAKPISGTTILGPAADPELQAQFTSALARRV